MIMKKTGGWCRGQRFFSKKGTFLMRPEAWLRFKWEWERSVSGKER